MYVVVGFVLDPLMSVMSMTSRHCAAQLYKMAYAVGRWAYLHGTQRVEICASLLANGHACDVHLHAAGMPGAHQADIAWFATKCRQ